MPLFPVKIVTFLILSCLSAVLDGSRILFLFPIPNKSHFVTFSVLAEELARRGHDVTMVTAYSLGKTVPNYNEIRIDQTVFGNVQKEYNFSTWKDISLFTSAYLNWEVFPEWLEKSLATEQLQSLINSQMKFDLVLGEFLFHQSSLLAFGHRFNAPVIDLCPGYPYLTSSGLMGNPQPFSYLPDTEIEYSDRMTFLERLHNTIFGIFNIAGTYVYSLPLHQEIIRKRFQYPGVETMPPVADLIANTSLVLVNSHFSLHYTRPYAPNMVEIGGFHVKTPKKLPLDMQRFMDEATEGVILVSFGTNIKAHMLSKDKEEAFLSVFREIKQRVIWRWDNEDAAKGLPNVMARKWVPQQSILAHQNCILYVTHGGIASLIEAIYYGVPLISLPFFVDQFHNAEYIQNTGIGLRLDIDQINHHNFFQAVDTVLNTPSVRIEEQSRIHRDQPQSPLERAVFWVEYVIRHKGAHHLKPASVYQPFYQIAMLDVCVFILFSISLTVILAHKMIFLAVRAVSGQYEAKEVHLKKH